MTGLKKVNNLVQWIFFLIGGALCSFLGAHKLFAGEPGVYGGVEIPVWFGWIQLPFGLLVTFLSIRAIVRGRRKPKSAINSAAATDPDNPPPPPAAGN